MLRLLFCFLLTSVTLHILAQERCGTVVYQKLLQQRRPARETADQFESWMNTKVQKIRSIQAYKIAATTYTVPVVVHVIHNGEAVGSGTNISDAQILSQIDVLNKDFQRLNADTTLTLSEFKPVAGKFLINFVLAKQDPNGVATNGIVRVRGTQTSWSVSDNYSLKAQSYWPAENYLNIWVTSLSNGYLGYTQLPLSSTLQGLEDASTDRLTDGVVVECRAFGTVQATGGSSFNLLSEYNRGRTATHEVGHFFGLRHVWGDVSGCSGTDYVSDTPSQDTNYNGTCPSGTQLDCSGHSMYANYMNYTDDACMNIFSKGQVNRMDVVINNSPRRASLLSSLGAQTPAPLPNDLQLNSISAPSASACSGSVVPVMVIRNFGSNTITSAQIELSVNGNSMETKTFASLNLSPSNQTTVSFNPVVLSAGTTNKFSFHVLQTNGGTDGRAINDTISISTRVPVTTTLPLIEPFNSTPANWTVYNPDGLVKWSNVTIGSNKAMWLNFWDYDNSGAIDRLITPVIDLTSTTVASLSFDYAYANLSGNYDRLRVLVSSTCDFSSAVELFNEAGSNLATTSNSGSSFTPSSSDWATKIFSLNQFIGQKIQIAFEGIDDYGNNLYLDNVAVLNYPITAFALNHVISPSPVSCSNTATLVISVKNLGNTVINSFTADVYINNQKTTQQLTGLQIELGSSKNISLAPLTFATGANTLAITVKSPNGATGALTKDSLSTKRNINAASDIIPLRQNFDGNFDSWTTMSPDFKSVWYPASTNKNLSMIFDAYTNTSIGAQAWLVSPVLDFSKAEKASLFFETSYGYRTPRNENLQVLLSTDCGLTFPSQLFSSSGSDLQNATSNTAWTPSSSGQWTDQPALILDSLAGKKNVRIAFVATNANGNNLYLDNIEFFVDDDPNPPRTPDKNYRIYETENELKITFNLTQTQTVQMQVYDVMGQPLGNVTLENVLNQTYSILDSSSVSSGMFIVRVQMQSPASLSTTKVLFVY